MISLHRSASDAIRGHQSDIAQALVTLEFSRHPELERRYGAVARDKSLQDAGHHLSFLAQALALDNQSMFIDYVAWSKVVLARRNVSAADFAFQLACLAEVLPQTLPEDVGRLARSFVEAAASAMPSMPEDLPTLLHDGAPLSPIAHQYFEALLRGDRTVASRLVLDAVAAGTPVKQIYLDVFQPAQYEIGRLWQTNRMTVAQEHYFTAATQLIMSQLYPYIFANEKNGRTLVATCVVGDLHELGIRMVADFFELAGWSTYFLGSNTPHADVIATLKERNAEVLAVSATIPHHVDAVMALIGAVRADPGASQTRILVGGRPFNHDPELWRKVGADGTAPDAESAIVAAGRPIERGAVPILGAESGGIVVICGRDGTVEKVIRDDLGGVTRIQAGTALRDLADAPAREKLEAFRNELRARGAAYEWEITVSVDGASVLVNFSGAVLEDRFLVVAARSGIGATRLRDELMLINNERTNALRARTKELSQVTGGGSNGELPTFEALTRLNNEMANLQREMARKNSDLETLSQQKNRLLGMAAHDLRAPLGIILSYAEFLDEDAGDRLTEEHREFLITIKQTSKFMLKLVTDLLDVSAIEAGQLRLDRKPIDLASLVQRSVTLNRILAGKKNIDIEFEAPPGLPKFDLDTGKIRQVLDNLISNGIKFSHPHTRIRVVLTLADDIATVSVTDQGQGIPESEVSKLFKPFGTLSVRGTAGETSTGLGLAIVRRIVEGHGGRIGVESKIGVGSTFFFSVPVTPAGSTPSLPQELR